MHPWIKKSLACVLCVSVAACGATTNSAPSTLPASSAPTFAQEDIVPVTAPDGRSGIWVDEKAFGEILAGVAWEKGEERKRTQEQKTRAELAEKTIKQMSDAQQPFRLFLTYGVPSALVAAAIAALAAFFGGFAAARSVPR
jgi:hypothetical protein